MTDRGDPTESYDGRITVRILDDATGKRVERCLSYAEAIGIVKANQYSDVVTRIVYKDGDTVFTPAKVLLALGVVARGRDRAGLNDKIIEEKSPKRSRPLRKNFGSERDGLLRAIRALGTRPKYRTPYIDRKDLECSRSRNIVEMIL